MDAQLSGYYKTSTVRRRARLSANRHIQLREEEMSLDCQVGNIVDTGYAGDSDLITASNLDFVTLQRADDNVFSAVADDRADLELDELTDRFDNELPYSDSLNVRYVHAYSDSDDSDMEQEETCLADKLANWALRFSVSLTALSALLLILRNYHPLLPKDARTLLKTSRKSLTENRAGGSYFYRGILAALSKFLESVHAKYQDGHTFYLQLNIDGLPLFRSSEMQFWPVLGMLQSTEMKTPFVISLFCGLHKPKSSHEFLRDLVQEINTLAEGFLLHGKTFFLKISSVLCDTPARAFVKGTKSHTGYHGCDKCLQPGEYDTHRMTFPENNATLRTDRSFELQTDDDHHLNRSPFQDTNLGMVSQFPLDYMHLVCLGVMKRLIGLWMKGPLQCRLPAILIETLSTKLVGFKGFIPSEFGRRPRSLVEVAHWKATEFRQFLLYTGPVALLGILNDQLYRNFMLYFVGIYILCSPSLSASAIYREYAHSLLVLFTEHYSQLFGKHLLVYNIHGLVHLTKDVELHGHLDCFSCFPFENYLGKLKRLVRKPHLPLSQVIRRISEYSAHDVLPSVDINPDVCRFKRPHSNGPLPSSVVKADAQYKEAFLKWFCVKCFSPDNCVSLCNNIKPVLIRNIIRLGDIEHVVYEEFERCEAFFDYPLSSCDLGIFVVYALSGHMKYCTLDNIAQKFVMLPVEEKHVCIPVLHLR